MTGHHEEIENVVCEPFSDDPTIACEVICSSRRLLRSLSRQLQASGVVKFEVTITKSCDACNDVSQAQVVTDTIYQLACDTIIENTLPNGELVEISLFCHCPTKIASFSSTKTAVPNSASVSTATISLSPTVSTLFLDLPKL